MLNAWIASHLDYLQYLPYVFSLAVIVFFLTGWYYGNFLSKKGTPLVIRAPIANAIFGLSALVLGFTFSSAASHFDVRVSDIRAEAFSLNKVYRSTRFLNLDDQVLVQHSLKELLNLRMSAFKNLHSLDELEEKLQLMSNKLEEIDEQISSASKRTSEPNQTLADKYLKPQFNILVDTFNAGALIAKNHPPLIILEFLFILLCIGSLLSGYAMAVEKEEDWLLTLMYLIITGYALFVIFSLEFPNQLYEYDTLNREFLILQNVMK